MSCGCGEEAVIEVRRLRSAFCADCFLKHCRRQVRRTSNLGVVNIEGPLKPTALWGPVLPCHLENEDSIGVTTFGGQLRMVACAFGAPDKLLTRIRDVLHEAIIDNTSTCP